MSNKKSGGHNRLSPQFFYDFFLYNMVLVVARNWGTG